MNELSYVLIRLVQSYSKIASKDTEPWIEGLALACSSYNGAKVALTADVI